MHVLPENGPKNVKTYSVNLEAFIPNIHFSIGLYIQAEFVNIALCG